MQARIYNEDTLRALEETGVKEEEKKKEKRKKKEVISVLDDFMRENF